MSSRYAANTTVSTSSSRDEIERTLARYGATSFAYATEPGRASIQFVAHDRRVRFIVPMPDRDSHDFTLTPTGRERSATAAHAEWEKAGRQVWRALALLVKAQLEAVEAGIITFEDAFLAHTVLPSGQTVAETVGPQVEAAYLDSASRVEIEA